MTVAHDPSLPGRGFLSISDLAVPGHFHAQGTLPGIWLLLGEEERIGEAVVSAHHINHTVRTRGSPSSHKNCGTQRIFWTTAHCYFEFVCNSATGRDTVRCAVLVRASRDNWAYVAQVDKRLARRRRGNWCRIKATCKDSVCCHLGPWWGGQLLPAPPVQLLHGPKRGLRCT